MQLLGIQITNWIRNLTSNGAVGIYLDWIHLAEDRDQWRGSCELSNGPSGFIKGGEFLDQLCDC